MIRIKDLLAAEAELDEAEREFEESGKPENWSARESLDDMGRRHVLVNPSHFERRERLQQRVQAARQSLIALRRAFIEGV
ncbi:hypothetical protein ACFYUD_03740 [Nocardia tengchongensis]|uniref:hypothetical protein n=1 Tax=Nocardia tengchongensis TaxID=2055889 RepID=UPI003694C959